jgi:uncharacterized protein (TIGR02646 family)
MRAITKGAEPPSLTVHRLTPRCDYDNYADKVALRHALVTEQRGICCYCMQRIHNGPLTMKIEHWQSQSGYPAEQLSYRNLLGACLGGDGQPPHLQHCDTRKGNRDLRWNPAEPVHHVETRVRYELDGSIRSDDAAFDAQLDDVLNLNIRFLKNNRKAVWVAITDWWKLEKARLHGPVSRARIQVERDRRVAGKGELEPFCRVAIWWLDQRLARMPA